MQLMQTGWRMAIESNCAIRTTNNPDEHVSPLFYIHTTGPPKHPLPPLEPKV